DEDKNGDLVKQNFLTHLIDREGNVWVGSQNRGLYRFNTKSFQVKHFTKESNGGNALPDNSILSLCLDSHGNLLIGTQRKGLCLYNSDQDQITPLPIASKDGNVLEGGILSIAKDLQETVWVGTERNGLK